MKPRVILAHLTGSDGDEPVMQTALDLAPIFEGHVSALSTRPRPTDLLPLAAEGMSAPLIEQMIASAEAENARTTARVHDVFATACRLAGIEIAVDRMHALPSATLHDEIGSEDALLIRYGRVADLILAAKPPAAGAEALELTGTLEAALFESARPVLLVPSDGRGRSPLVGGAVTIAWNGSAQAARAVAASLEFLRKAGSVSAVAVDEGKGDGGLGPLIEYLAWHGVTATPVALRAESADVGKRILAEAESRTAGLLVMGAYTHSRLREWVLGGATRHVIAATTIPVLMAH